MSQTNELATVPPESWWARLWATAACLFHRGVTLDQEIKTELTAHPDIIAEANALAAMAPPEVQRAVNVTEQLAAAVQQVADHAEAAGVAPAGKQ